MIAEFRRFGETSSMKGVPRAIKAESNVIRCLWIIAVLGLMSISITMCARLITQYIKQPRVIKIEDLNALANTDMSLYYDNFHLFSLPDITVCNLNPLTGYKHINGDHSWEDYIALVKSFEENLPPQFAYKLTQIGYLETLGPKLLGSENKPDDFIIGCSFGFYGQIQRVPCGQLLVTEPVPNILYSQCYTVRLNNSALLEMFGMAPVSLSLVLYFDETSDTVLHHLMEETRDSVGAMVTFQETERLPIFETGIKVSPGQHTVVTINHASHEKAAEDDRGRPCKPSTNEFSTMRNFANVKYKYSVMGCMYQSMQSLTHNICGCITSFMYVLPENVTVDNLRFCGGSLDNITKMQEELLCSQFSVDSGESTMESCPISCKELVSNFHVTSAKWPSLSAQFAFYYKYISGKPYEKHFKEYKDIMDDFSRDSNNTLFIKKLRALNLIENNFAKVEFTAPTLRASIYSSGYQITFAALIANIGGNLNLWSGISVVIVIEVFELLVRWCQTAMKQHPSSKVVHIKEISKNKVESLHS